LSEQNNLWPLRLIAVAVACGIWIFASYLPRLQELRVPKVTQVFRAPVTYSTPADFMVLNAEQTVEVRLQGSEEAINSLSNDDVKVAVVFEPPLEAGTLAITLEADDVNVEADENVEVVSLTPNRLDILVDEVATRLVPVLWNRKGEPGAGAELQEVVVEPAEVEVRGPRTRLDQLTGVTTQPINLAAHVVSFEQKVEVQAEDPLVTVVGPRLVTVYVTLEPPTIDVGQGF
jgi:YbbR domain-containing protein